MLFQKKELVDVQDETVSSEIAEEVKVDHSDRYIVLAIAFELLFGVLVFLKSQEAGKNYLFALAPLILFTGFIGNLCYQKSCDMKMFCMMAVLSSLGIGVQLSIDQLFYTSMPFSLLKYTISVIVAVLFVGFYAVFRRLLNFRLIVFLMLVATVGLYGVMYKYGYDPNGYGTRAWLVVGPYTVQLTDFTKVIALLFYASLFSSSFRDNENVVLVTSTLFIFLNGLGSVLIHELGSFFIIFFLHLALLFIYLDHSKKKRLYLCVIFALSFVSIVIAFWLYNLLLPQYEAGTLDSIQRFLWPFVKKIYERFSLTANVQNDPWGAGYQLLQARKVMWFSGIFGNTIYFNRIPVVESDMAFIALIDTFGWPLGFLMVFLLSGIAMHAGRVARRLYSKDPQDSVSVAGAGAMLYMQGLLVILGSCNIIPLTGLPIPFISRGFTYQTIVFCFCAILLHRSKEKEVC